MALPDCRDRRDRFIGRMIVEMLAVIQVPGLVLARNPDRAKFLKPMGQVGQISIHGGDALDDAALDEVMGGADAVVNTIGILAEQVASGLTACKPNCQQGSRPERLASGLNVVHISAIGADPRARHTVCGLKRTR